MKDLTDLLYKYNQKYEIVGGKVVVGDDLYLERNDLSYLPESIGNLKCIELLLYHNKLSSLPDSIGNLECESLFLYNNNLTSLPDSIGNLECESLFLHNNNLTSLPILNKNITSLSIDNFKDLTNLLYLPNLTDLWIGDDYYVNESLTDFLNKIRHQKVMNDMNKILETL